MDSCEHDITIALLFVRLKASWRLLLITIVAVVALMTIVMYSIPEYYRCDEIVGYDERSSSIADGLQAIGVEHGFDVDLHSSNWDAIYPIHFSFILKSNEFMYRIMKVQIATSDGEEMSYFDYLRLHPQKNWWSETIDDMKGWFSHTADVRDIAAVNPHRMTDEEERVFDNARKKILCSSNTQKNIVVISVLDQDPYICAQMSDSVRLCLQQYMSDYRNAKMERQEAFYGRVVETVRQSYEASLKTYTQYINTHTDVMLSSVQIEANRLQLDLMQKKTILDAVNLHYQSTLDLLHENLPVFDMIQKAGIPVKAAGPKRWVNVSIAASLAFVMMILFLLREDLFYQLR